MERSKGILYGRKGSGVAGEGALVNVINSGCYNKVVNEQWRVCEEWSEDEALLRGSE